MSFFRRNRDHLNERPFVSWAPTTEPDTAAHAETALASVGSEIPSNTSPAVDALSDRPAPHERGRRS